MSSKNLALVVGSYGDDATASEDYQALRGGQDAGGYEIIGAVVLVRSDDGKVQVKEHGAHSVGHGARSVRARPVVPRANLRTPL
jgi:uncharacterized membrane protein